MTTLTTYSADLASSLKQLGETIAVAESSSGGLISAGLLAVPGASTYFLGGGVVYTLEARRTLLNIPDDVVEGMSPLSEDYVLHCARAIRENLNATWGLAEIGATGPQRRVTAIPQAPAYSRLTDRNVDQNIRNWQRRSRSQHVDIC